MITENFTPLAPATSSLPSSSRIVARTCRRYLADMAMASVRLGMATLFGHTPSAITGNTFNRIAKKYIKSSATKKFGMLFPRKLQIRIR